MSLQRVNSILFLFANIVCCVSKRKHLLNLDWDWISAKSVKRSSQSLEMSKKKHFFKILIFFKISILVVAMSEKANFTYVKSFILQRDGTKSNINDWSNTKKQTPNMWKCFVYFATISKMKFAQSLKQKHTKRAKN